MEDFLNFKVKSVVKPNPHTYIHGSGFDTLAQKEIYAPETESNHLLNPQQKLAWDSYITPKSKTFGNAYQSAMHAKYTEGYAAQITTKAWWLEKMRRIRLLGKAEKVLEEMLDMPVDVLNEGIKIHKNGTLERVPFVENSPALVKIKQDTSKFVAERLGKDEGYSSRSEISGPQGGPIVISEEKRASAKEAVRKYLDRKK